MSKSYRKQATGSAGNAFNAQAMQAMDRQCRQCRQCTCNAIQPGAMESGLSEHLGEHRASTGHRAPG